MREQMNAIIKKNVSWRTWHEEIARGEGGLADQLLTLFQEQIDQLQPAKLKAVPKKIFDYHVDTIQEKAAYSVGFQDGVEAQLAKDKDALRWS